MDYFCLSPLSGEKQKNDHSLGVMNKILDNAAWINIHWLPVSIVTFQF